MNFKKPYKRHARRRRYKKEVRWSAHKIIGVEKRNNKELTEIKKEYELKM